LRTFLTAIGFLTRIPVPGADAGGERLGRATVFFPLVGAFIGLILIGANAGAERLWHTAAVDNGLVLLALVLVTGGLHLDGLMDTCDGAFGGRSRERALEIMKDSRVGAFGVLGAILLLLVKFAFLSALHGDLKWHALLFMPVAGRWALVYAVAHFPYARPSGTGRAFKDQVTWAHLVAASLVAVVVGALVFRLAFLVLAVAVWFAAWAQGRYLTRKLGGLTGDAYGAIGEVTEAFVLAAVPLAARLSWS